MSIDDYIVDFMVKAHMIYDPREMSEAASNVADEVAQVPHNMDEVVPNVAEGSTHNIYEDEGIHEILEPGSRDDYRQNQNSRIDRNIYVMRTERNMKCVPNRMKIISCGTIVQYTFEHCDNMCTVYVFESVEGLKESLFACKETLLRLLERNILLLHKPGMLYSLRSNVQMFSYCINKSNDVDNNVLNALSQYKTMCVDGDTEIEHMFFYVTNDPMDILGVDYASVVYKRFIGGVHWRSVIYCIKTYSSLSLLDIHERA